MAKTESRREARARAAQVEAERQNLRRQLEEVRGALRQAYAIFDQVSDPDLVEAQVFEMNAQRSRHAYLLRRLRELDQPPAEEPSAPARARA